MHDIEISSNENSYLIRNLDTAKAFRPDDISGRMLKICDESVITPLSIIYNNIIKTGIYPDLWKLASPQKR